MPTTVSNFSKVVYATTGYLELSSEGILGTLSAVDFYAMCADVVSAIIFSVSSSRHLHGARHALSSGSSRGTAVALNLFAYPVDVRVESGEELAHDFQWSPATHELYGAALWHRRRRDFRIVPVVTRGLCSVCLQSLRRRSPEVRSGISLGLGLLIATWTLRGFFASRFASSATCSACKAPHARAAQRSRPGLKSGGWVGLREPRRRRAGKA